ncbi:MAG: ankyrin repeat domain-containing protein [Candidatus Anstonellales archaeon]
MKQDGMKKGLIKSLLEKLLKGKDRMGESIVEKRMAGEDEVIKEVVKSIKRGKEDKEAFDRLKEINEQRKREVGEEKAEYLGAELMRECKKASFSDLAKVVKLIAQGADIEIKDEYDETPLGWAAQNGHLKLLKALIGAGANVNAKDMFGDSVLLISAEEGHWKVVKELIKAGANIDSKGDEGYTALMRAAENGHLKIVKELLDAGANPLIKNYFGETTADVAKTEEIREVIKKHIENVRKSSFETFEKWEKEA